mmetsp:Transcript_29209/g.76479  ORF Transcript_29209/g.76479 Transcript_29209/m.76479 type:complete len:286 (-) Transcript_29209:189-1046(-)
MSRLVLLPGWFISRDRDFDPGLTSGGRLRRSSVSTKANVAPCSRSDHSAAQWCTDRQFRRPQLPISGTGSPRTPCLFSGPSCATRAEFLAGPGLSEGSRHRAIPARTTPVVHGTLGSTCLSWTVGSAAKAGRSTHRGGRGRASCVHATQRPLAMQKSRHASGLSATRPVMLSSGASGFSQMGVEVDPPEKRVLPAKSGTGSRQSPRYTGRSAGSHETGGGGCGTCRSQPPWLHRSSCRRHRWSASNGNCADPGAMRAGSSPLPAPPLRAAAWSWSSVSSSPPYAC